MHWPTNFIYGKSLTSEWSRFGTASKGAIQRGRIPCSILASLLLLCLIAGRARAQETNSLELFTNALQVLTLGVEGAQRAPHPVRLRAVVTYPVIGRPWFYAQDSTAGILVVCLNTNHQPSAGQLVEISGTAGPGLQAAHLYATEYRVIGTAPLPVPPRTDTARLALGEGFGQWVCVEGDVLDYLDHPKQLSLLLVDGNQHFVVNIRLAEPMEMPANWLGARVQVQGVCWTEARPDGVPYSFRIHTPGTNMITLLHPGSTNLFDLPLCSIASLASQPGTHDQRVRVMGSVTLSLAGQSLFLRDGSGAIQARLLKPISTPANLSSVNSDTLFREAPTNFPPESFARPRPYLEPLKTGDRVEVVGRRSASGFGLVLTDAEYHRLGPGIPPKPVEMSSKEFFWSLHEGDLVTWRGRLIDRETDQSAGKFENLLVLRDGSTTVLALLESGRERTLIQVPMNSLLQVTGVSSSVPDEWKGVATYRVLLRSPDDVRVLSQPPPWDSWHVGRILFLGALLGVAALACIGFLRRQVAGRTAELAEANRCLQGEIDERKQAQAELSRTLASEKELNQLKSQFVSLVSHEFRTPLGVILASADLLSDYLDTLTAEERAEQLADIKQSTMLMADLMEDVLVLGRVESGKMGYHPHDFDLLDFCQRLVDEMLSATNRRCSLSLAAADIVTLGRGDETLLRHIFHNLLANSIKYSAPGQAVQFNVRRAGDDAEFTVLDQGIGISVEDQKYVFEAFYRGKNTNGRPGSGLGLVVVKRCVELHGGTIQLKSTEGGGTTVTVRIPLFRLAGETEVLNRRSTASVQVLA